MSYFLSLAHVVAEGFDTGCLGERTSCQAPFVKVWVGVWLGHTAWTDTLLGMV